MKRKSAELVGRRFERREHEKELLAQSSVRREGGEQTAGVELGEMKRVKPP